MSEYSAKSIRSARKAKASKMGSADPQKKVDSSTWTPPELLNADVKTGMRPVSRRAFKSGGKVTGDANTKRADKAPRGAKEYVNAKVNRNVKDANEERSGIKHVGGMKAGGRAKKNDGGATQKAPPLPPRRSDYFPNEGKAPEAKDLYSKEDLKRLEAGRKHGGRTKKEGGGPMMGMPDQRMAMVQPTRMKFAGAQGTPYKKGGAAHSDEAADKKLIKKMVKPSALERCGGGRSMKADGGKIEKVMGEFKEGELHSGSKKGPTVTNPKQAMAIALSEAGKSRKARKDGGRAKGKTNINIIIGQPKEDTQVPPGMPMGARPPAMPIPAPAPGMPPGMAGGMPGMPPGGGGAPGGAPPMPPAGRPGMPPMGRKTGGRVTKVASSYRDMEAGAGSGEGRLQKTDIAKKLPKPKENGKNVYEGAGYPNKVTGATGGRTAKKVGGGVYRSYKDLDAGAGSGEGRLEKTEIQRNARGR